MNETMIRFEPAPGCRHLRSNANRRTLGLRTLAAVLLFGLGLAPSAHSSDVAIVDEPLPNGDFSQGLADWTVEVSPDPSAPPGAVSVVGGAARLSKGGAYRVALSQDFVAPEGLIALRLRLAELPQFGSTGAFIPEAFDIHVLRADSVSRVAAFRTGASAAANAAAVPAGFNLGAGTTLNGDQLRIELPGIAVGETLTLIATLVGASADTQAIAAIDDAVMEIETKRPTNPPVQRRIDDCELWRDSFEARRGVGVLPRCALGQLGDTGITTCAGGVSDDCPAVGLTGQDGDVGRDAEARGGVLEKLGSGPAGFDYAKLDAAGDPITLSATEWSCVVDNFTGLVWEVKVDDPLDPRHHEHTYSWFQPDPSADGGQAGTADGGACAGSACDISAYAEEINALNLCGADNWRVPTRSELATLVHAGEQLPAIALEFFPWGVGGTWTITPMAAQPDRAWQVNFEEGRVDGALKSSPLRVRLVREIVE